MPTKLSKSDLQFYPSERLADNDDGGGLALGTPIQGTADELFNPISSIERVNGGFHLRKVFAGVLRADDEPLIGAFVALTYPPKDPSVSYLITHADSFGQQRSDVIKDIEAFRVPTTASFMTLLGNHTKHSKQVTCYQRVDESLPQVGDVFCLKQTNVDNTFEQYIKVAKVESQNRRFTLNDRETFERTVIKITTTDSLIHDFVGVQKPSYDYISATTKIYDTQVVDAGRYFGISGIKQQIPQNSQTISVDNIFAKLIPTNQITTALTDLTANNALSAYIGKQAVDITINQYTQRLYVGNKIAPASLVIHTANGTLTDKIHNASTGTLYLNDTPMGVVDYGEGSIYLNTSMSVTSLSFGVAGKVVEYSQSDVIVVDTPSQTFTYQFKIAPVKGTLSITYQSMAKKYTLTDDGTGRLTGVSDRHGTGNMNYETGSLSLSLGSLPDVNSVILMTWATPITSFDDSQKAHKLQRIVNVGGMLSSITADVNGNTYTLDSKGNLVFNDNTFARLDKNLVIIDDLTTPFRLSTSVGKQKSQTFKKVLIDNDTMTLHFDDAFVKGSVTIDYELNIDGKLWGTRRVFDNAQGKLTDIAGNDYGTVDYALNLIKLKGNTQITIKTPKYEQVEI